MRRQNIINNKENSTKISEKCRNTLKQRATLICYSPRKILVKMSPRLTFLFAAAFITSLRLTASAISGSAKTSLSGPKPLAAGTYSRKNGSVVLQTRCATAPILFSVVLQHLD